jgi:hypothetical protein
MNSGAPFTLFNHMNSGAPYSAIYVYIWLKLMISCVGVPGFFWSRFNTYNNHCMLFKSSQIFCHYILADFPGLPLPSYLCILFMQFRAFFTEVESKIIV